MATKYVNKSGNDGNSGDSAADAWLTIQHAVDNIADGDTVIVQSGVYEENIVLPDDSKEIDLDADGYVIMDGSSIGGIALDGRSGSTGIEVDGFYILNYNYSTRMVLGDYVTLMNCYTNSKVYFYPVKLAHLPANNLFAKNTIVDNELVLERNNKGKNMYVENLTVTGLTRNMISSSNWEYRIKNCHFQGNLNFHDLGTLVNLDYNNIQGSITYKGTTYDTLSDFQDAYPDLAPHSINENGDFNNDYTLRWSSPNIGAGETGVNIGTRGPASYFESTDEIFEGANLTNVSRNANGDFELDGGATTGTVVSAVLDFGSDITLGNLRMEANEDYPADVIDSDVDDSEPNRANYEYRSATDADGSFAQGDATPSWNEAERGDDLSLTCRYFQVRITLRSNGVAA